MSRASSIAKYQFITSLQALPFIEQIWLFGSRARGDASERSDIDIAILCDTDTTDADWMKVMDIIEDADTLLKIDCIRFSREKLSNDLYQNIMKDKKVIYAKK